MSELERAFLAAWRRLYPDWPEPASEYRFMRWRFDFAWPAFGVAVELDGGVFVQGRHVSPAGFQKDLAKLNHAASAGWLVLRFTTDWLRDYPAFCCEQVAQAIRHRARDAAQSG